MTATPPSGPPPPRQYKRDVPRKGEMDAYLWDHLLGHVEQRRASMVQHMTKSGTVDGYNKPEMYYRQAIKPVLDELGAKDVPSVSEFRKMSKEEQKRTIQRALTHLSHKLLGEGTGKGKQSKKQQQKKQDKKEESQPQGQQQPSPQQQDKKDEKGEDEGEGQEEEQDGEQEEEQPSDGQGEPSEDHAEERSEERPEEQDKDGEEEESSSSHGGGDQTYGTGENASLFYVIRSLIRKLAEDVDYDETENFGNDRWDVNRVVQSKWNVQLLENARRQYETTVENIYLVLDTSGSVSMYAGAIASMAAGAAGIVHLYTGTEARPQLRVERSTPLRSVNEPFPEWLRQRRLDGLGSKPVYSHTEYERYIREFNQTHFASKDSIYWDYSFDADVGWWLAKERPPKGSRIIFWGDTQGCGIEDPLVLKRLLRDYKVLWLQSMDRQEVEVYRSMLAQRGIPPSLENFRARPGRYDDIESIKLEAVGIPVLYGVTTPAAIRRSLQLVS